MITWATVVGRRADGYHELESLLAFAQHQILFDRAGLERARTEDVKNEIRAGLKPEPVT